MSYFTIPVNISHITEKNGARWNYFDEIPIKQKAKKDENDALTETFLYNEQMQIGDYALLYITYKGIIGTKSHEAGYRKAPGIYAICSIISEPRKMNDINDKNYDETVVEVSIDYYSLDKPLAAFPYGVEPTLSSQSRKPFKIVNVTNQFHNAFNQAKNNATYKPINKR